MSTLAAYVTALDLQHERALAVSAVPGRDDFTLNSLLAVGCGLLALGLFVVGGYRVGFDEVHLLATRLPERLLHALTFSGDPIFAVGLFAFIARRRPHVLW